MNVGFVGVGVMGEPMATNLVKAGFAVSVRDVATGPVERLVAQGATAADSLAAIAEAEVVILMLPSPQVVREVGRELLATPGRMRVLIDMSTSDPAVDDELAALAKAAGVGYLDAPVSRAVQAAWDGNLLIMVGGDAADLELARPVLDAMGSDVHHCGGVGAGHKLKLLNNLKIMAEIDLIAEVLRLADRDGLDLPVVEQILASSSSRSFMWDYQAGRMVREDFVPGFSVTMGLKDLTLGLAWAERVGVRMPISEQARADFARGVAQDLGAQDTASLITMDRETT
jgi:3-hydroxyisobutyrate dehydrogenase-like beta-hydroxyacid dehydrogenase